MRLLLVLLTLLWAQPALAATKWLRADTHNFIIYSSGKRDQLQQFAENVERFDALLRQRTGVVREDRPNRLTIYLLGESGDVARMVSDKKSSIAGIYMARREGTFAIANRETADSKLDLSGNTVLFHEYAHHFMFHNFNAPYPAWYVEGFAEYVSTAVIKPTGDWTLGTPPYHRAVGLLVTRKPTIDSLLFGQAMKRNTAETDAFYGRAWLLVHMLGSDEAWKGKSASYLKAIGDGMGHREAATSHFGDLAELDKALDKYLKRPRITVLSSKRAVTIDGTIAIAELDPLASQLIELGLKRRTGKEPTKTRDSIAALAAKNPASAEPWYELAMAELALGQQDPDSEADAKDAKDDGLAVPAAVPDDTRRKQSAAAAMTATDRALVADPDHVRANVLKARLLFEILRDKGEYEAVPWRDARSYIIKANAKASLDPLPLATWFESFLAQGRAPTKVASDGLALAFNLAPEVEEFRVNYAFDLARQGNYEAAIRLVEVLAYNPHRGAMGKAVLERIKAIRDAKNKQADEDKAGS